MAHYYGRPNPRGGRPQDQQGSQEHLDSYTATEVTEESFDDRSAYTNSVYGSRETLDDGRSQASSRPSHSRRFRPAPNQQRGGGGRGAPPQQSRQAYDDPNRSPPHYDESESSQRGGAPPQRFGYQARPRSPSPSQYSESQYSQSQYSQSQYSQSQYSQSQYSQSQYGPSQYSQSQYSQSQYSEQPSARGRQVRPPQQHMRGAAAHYGGPGRSGEPPRAPYQERKEPSAPPVGQEGAGRYGAPSSMAGSQDHLSEVHTGSQAHYGGAVGGTAKSSTSKYSQRPHYQQKGAKGKTKSIVKIPGFYNKHTDTILRTKKTRKGFLLSVAKPYAKNYHQGSRDFLPVAVASVIFNPIVGWVPLAFSLMARKANFDDEPEKAAYLGRTACVTAVVCFIITIFFFIIVLAVVQDGDEIAPRLH